MTDADVDRMLRNPLQNMVEAWAQAKAVPCTECGAPAGELCRPVADNFLHGARFVAAGLA